MRKNITRDWISVVDCNDFYAAEFGWEEKR